jgi:hypothetical protein
MIGSPLTLTRLRRARFPGTSSILLAAAACSAPRGPQDHLLLLDGNGSPHDPAHPVKELLLFNGYAALSDDEYTAYVNKLRASVSDYVEHAGAHPRIVIFVNGGLDGMSLITDRAQKLSDRIVNDGSDAAFPIFVGWDTDALHTLGNHYFVVRRGFQEPWLAALTFPFVLAEDLTRGIIHLPQDVLYYNVDTFWRGRYHYRPASIRSSQAVSHDLAAVYVSGREDPAQVDEDLHEEIEQRMPRAEGAERTSENTDRGDVIEFRANPDDPLPDPWPLYFVRYLIEMPIHVPQHVLIDGMGGGAWDEMDRRARVLFEGVEDEAAGTTKPAEKTALVVMLKALAEVQSECAKAKVALRVDLVCHSMGAIVGNRILRLASRVDPEGTGRVPKFENVVYMGAACTISDYESAVFPYLASEAHKSTHFYHLTLEERAESAESTLFGIVPFGSLLMWIDSYYSHSLTPTDRVAGRFTNLMNNYRRTPTRLRKRIHIKAFGTDPADAEHALVHGDFSNLDFWKARVWQPDADASWRPPQSDVPATEPAKSKIGPTAK